MQKKIEKKMARIMWQLCKTVVKEPQGNGALPPAADKGGPQKMIPTALFKNSRKLKEIQSIFASKTHPQVTPKLSTSNQNAFQSKNQTYVRVYANIFTFTNDNTVLPFFSFSLANRRCGLCQMTFGTHIRFF